MPQLDFLTVQSQIVCLLFSIFFIYSFLLKYTLAAYDAFLRLKLKKINAVKGQILILTYASKILRNKMMEQVSLFSEGVSDLVQIHVRTLINPFVAWYSSEIFKKVVLNSHKRKISSLKMWIFLLFVYELIASKKGTGRSLVSLVEDRKTRKYVARKTSRTTRRVFSRLAKSLILLQQKKPGITFIGNVRSLAFLFDACLLKSVYDKKK